MTDIEEQIFLCENFIDKCDVKYPCFKNPLLCGKSYIGMTFQFECKNYELIKKIVGEEQCSI